MSHEKEAICIEDSDDEYLTFDQREAIRQVQSILRIRKPTAKQQLIECDWNIEIAIGLLLETKQDPSEVKTNPQHTRNSHSLNCIHPSNTTKRSLFPDDASNKISPQPVTLSSRWHECYHNIRSTGEKYFIDPDFPPVATSLDGRQRKQGDSTVVKCKCGYPVVARVSQSDGPNYGRFYLACGQPKRRRAEVVVVSKSPPASPKIHNPYAKNQPTPPSSPPQRASCNFFRWDQDGSQGASGYATRYSLLSWKHFGVENHCRLVPNTGFGPSQIQQGAVGNCWFLSALAVVAERPYLIQQIIPHEGLNDAGCYQVNLCLDGRWTSVIVDSNLPVVTQPVGKAGQKRDGILLQESLVACPAFCAIPERVLWPALVEKAYAKVHGSYARLSGGFIAEGLTDLTGAPTETIIFGPGFVEHDDFWVRLMSFHQVGFCMGVATARGGDGLVGGHAYSILDVLEIPCSVIGEQSKVTDYFIQSPQKKLKFEDVHIVKRKPSPQNDRATVRLVRIRNPWGKREWKGDWSADSERWTRALRYKLGSQTFAKGDGTFFMSYEDMMIRFHHMDVAKTRKGWLHTSKDGQFRKCYDPLATSSMVYFLFSAERTEAFLSLYQPKKRSNTGSSYWYGDPSFIVMKRRSETEEWSLESVIISGVSQSSDCDIFLDPSLTYCCIPFSCVAYSGTKYDIDFRLVAYSAQPVEIKPMDNATEYQLEALRLLQKELINCDRKLIYNVAPCSFLTCVHGKGCLYFLGVNGALDMYLSVRLTFDVENGILIGYGHNEESYDIPPRTQKLLAVVMRNGKYTAATNVKFRYLSSTVKVAQEQVLTASRMNASFGCALEISIHGDVLASGVDETAVSVKGGDVIDTYLWIPQYGSSTET